MYLIGAQNEDQSITCNMAGVEGRGSKSESCQSDTRITMQVFQNCHKQAKAIMV